MRITICHLSDIHFATCENTILEKQKKLCDAILQDALKKDVIIFIVSGDIAQSGQEHEYEIAYNFFTEIQEYLEKKKELKVLFFFAPGNHDCDFTNEQNNKDDDLRREKVINERDKITEDEWTYFIDGLCQKQKEYCDFVNLFEYDNIEGIQVKLLYHSKLLTQFKVVVEKIVLRINLLNSAWLTVKKEKPGYLFFPSKEYHKITKDNFIEITVYHHPNNWMHPNDRNEFNRWVMNKSDLVYVGHEHFGRNESVETRDTVYHAQYGEVLQDRENDKKSGFIISYIEDNDNVTNVFNWDDNKKMYTISYSMAKKLDTKDNKYLYFQKDFQKYLETADIRISHPRKAKVTMRDLYVYPDIEEYKNTNSNYNINEEYVMVRGDELLDYILKTKRIAFSGGAKSGKTALAKNIAYDLIEKGKYSIIMDCTKFGVISDKNLKKNEEICISRAYGKEYIVTYRQLDLSNKMLILDNFEKVRDRKSKQQVLEYFDNFYDYILTFSNTTFELELLDESLNHEKNEYTHCSISELGYRRRNQLITKWYYLSEGGDIIVDDLVKEKISEAMATIDVLKGNGYMPCIPPHILIILQQLEYSIDVSNQERSNYGYLYEFLITKSILDMNQNCEYVHKDIAFGILTNIASHMLCEGTKVISLDKYKNIVYQYNKEYQTDANAEQYLYEYGRVELLNEKENQVFFGYPYIHYYFAAKYLSNNISKEWAREKIKTMSSQLYEEECGDIMIFLCHISKDDFIINTVLKNAKGILSDKNIFDFGEHKSICLSFDEYLKSDFIPEEDIDKREDELLEMRDRQERENRKQKKIEVIEEDREYIYYLDNAFKTIEVMGQILKNYPGTIKGNEKNDLLETIYAVGMRTLSYISDILYGGIERIFENISKRLQPTPSQIEMSKIKELSQKLNSSMDNLFGLLSYAMLRNLANSIANKALMPVIEQSSLNDKVGYNLVKDSLQLNEFGIIAVELILKEYDDYNDKGNIFAAKLLRLLVLDHFYVYGSKDYKSRQKIWEKMQFGEKDKMLTLQNDKNKQNN